MNDVIELFPPGAAADAGGELVVGGCRLRDLAARVRHPGLRGRRGRAAPRAREYRDELAAALA